MIKTYVVVFQNAETGVVGMDKFSDPTQGAARKSFRECYRHANYNILAVAEVPEIKKRKPYQEVTGD